MYLDTDIILALTKKEDWLKKHVPLSKLKSAKTSVLTIIEAKIVLEREYGREEALAVLAYVRKLGIELLPLDTRVLEKSQYLQEKYPQLHIFDAVHAGFAFVYKELLVSTDTLFPQIEEIDCRDPREL